MTVELTQDVSDRLQSDQYGWLTTVAESGEPVPRLVWFYFVGADFTVYSTPQAAQLADITERPHVSLNLDSDGDGYGIVVTRVAKVDATGVDCREDGPYWAKYSNIAARYGLAEAMASHSTRLKISPTNLWTTPTG
ncbi:MAG: TIGR03667 family PPOX class F420-dependent oxidoreductase [Mycobacterium sp.]|nr:TIGR03667 family PPOX class F420-dependent oxidoreductase [Mycobacterium sp.]